MAKEMKRNYDFEVPNWALNQEDSNTKLLKKHLNSIVGKDNWRIVGESVYPYCKVLCTETDWELLKWTLDIDSPVVPWAMVW